MKVYIGKYKSSISFYTITEKIFFWAKRKDEFGLDAPSKWVELIADLLTYGKPKLDSVIFPEDKTTWLHKLVNKFNSERKIKVKIHKYDTWSMDSTLSYVITPLLKQYKESIHSFGNVSDRDVPKELRSTSAPPLTQEQKDIGQSDELAEKRWNWVLDEMIFAFESVNNSEIENQFWSGNYDLTTTPEYVDGKLVGYTMGHGPNHTQKFDRKGYEAHYKRMKNGFVLFGKYYLDLWD
jgi:hypothetical protein